LFNSAVEDIKFINEIRKMIMNSEYEGYQSKQAWIFEGIIPVFCSED